MNGLKLFYPFSISSHVWRLIYYKCHYLWHAIIVSRYFQRFKFKTLKCAKPFAGKQSRENRILMTPTIPPSKQESIYLRYPSDRVDLFYTENNQSLLLLLLLLTSFFLASSSSLCLMQFFWSKQYPD